MDIGKYACGKVHNIVKNITTPKIKIKIEKNVNIVNDK